MSYQPHHEPRPSPRSRPKGENSISHTINRSGLQPCEICKRYDHAHLVLTEGHARVWAIFCEQHCPVCAEVRAARLRALLTVLRDPEDTEATTQWQEAA